MSNLETLKIKIFADGADKAGILALYGQPHIHGITTNPTLMRKAGISDYEAFARDILETVRAKPISLEVFADDFAEMKRQALMIAGWGDNVFVKIPVTDINGQSAAPLVRELASEGVKLNVTAILTLQQVDEIAAALNPAVDAVVSVFAGRIADTGVDPMPIMHESLAKLTHLPKAELLWASVREVINLKQAEAVGCHIVTVTHDILAKAEKMLGTDLAGLSLDTVRMFSRDAASAGYRL